MNLYLDTSSLLKLFLEEPGVDIVSGLAAAADRLHISRVGYVEGRAGLARARQLSRIAAEEYSATLGRFETTWRDLVIADVTEPLVRLAGDLTEKHILRGFDAIHLASAVTLQRELAEPITFSAFDDHLNDSAAAEGLLLP